jgi:sugar phosphate permease
VKYRHRVLGLLSVLSVITYLDRVCISVAGPRIQDEFRLSAEQWGLVTGAFAIAYAAFEFPSGWLADRFGARAMLLRIVLWWSAFTTLTAVATKIWALVLIRFLFGAGEAGAYPTTSAAVYRWFPPLERGRSFGIILLSGQFGAAIAPLLIVPLQVRFGWRVSFCLFGVIGVGWSVLWWRGYRNSPAEQAGISPSETAQIGAAPEATANRLNARALLTNKSVWAVMGATCAYLYCYYFFLFWLPTYLMRERGFSENETQLSALPFLLGMAANFSGGYARDAAVRRWGARAGPRAIGVLGLATAALAAFAALRSASGYGAIAWLALCYGGITFQQPVMFSTCVDIGRRNSGAVVGCMNTAGALGGLLSSLVFGTLVQRFGSYDAVLLSMVFLLGIGAILWLAIDATATLALSPRGSERRAADTVA